MQRAYTSAYELVSALRLLWASRKACANRPNWLICNYSFGKYFCTYAVQYGIQLCSQDTLSQTRLALLQSFTHTKYWGNTNTLRSNKLSSNICVALAISSAALRVANNYIAGTKLFKHIGTHLPSICANFMLS